MDLVENNYTKWSKSDKEYCGIIFTNTRYYFGYGILIGGTGMNGQIERKKKLRKDRNIALLILLLFLIVSLTMICLYMKPQRIEREYQAYNTGYKYGETGESSEFSLTHNIVFDISVKKGMFKDDELTGSIMVEDTEYIVSSDNLTETADMYKLIIYTEDGSVLDFDSRLDINISKDFEMFKFESSSYGPYSYIAPAENVDEAKKISERFEKLE